MSVMCCIVCCVCRVHARLMLYVNFHDSRCGCNHSIHRFIRYCTRTVSVSVQLYSIILRYILLSTTRARLLARSLSPSHSLSASWRGRRRSERARGAAVCRGRRATATRSLRAYWRSVLMGVLRRWRDRYVLWPQTRRQQSALVHKALMRGVVSSWRGLSRLEGCAGVSCSSTLPPTNFVKNTLQIRNPGNLGKY